MVMDVLCDTLLLEEILPRLPPKFLLFLGATARRFYALARRADHAARFYQRAGVLFQPLDQPKEAVPRFLTARGGHAPAAELLHGADLAFLPGPSAREAAYLRHVGEDPDVGFAVVHSTGGLVLCSRGRIRAVHLYVCNPVTWQWVALPELPLPVCKYHRGHLTVATTGGGGVIESFTVVVTNQSCHWRGRGGQLDLRVFASSGTGHWESRRFKATVPIDDDIGFGDREFCRMPPMLDQSGTSYWSPYFHGGKLLIAYDSAGAAGNSIRVVTLPDRLIVDNINNHCIGERRDGGLRYAQSSSSELQVWDAQQGGRGTMSSWTLVHTVGAVELVERNPEAAAFLSIKNPRCWDHYHLKPIGIHPTDDDVIFLALPGAVVAYSMEHGTISLGCPHPHDDSYYVSATEAFPYAHPPFPVQIPAIKSSTLALPDNGGSAASSVGNVHDIWKKKRKRKHIFTELN